MSSSWNEKNNIEYRGKFISKNVGQGMKLINHNQICLQSGYDSKSAKMDTPINIGQDAIYSWQIKMDHNYNDMNTLTECDMFGVVSNKCNNIGTHPFNGLIDSYGISGWYGHVYLGTSQDWVRDYKYK
eukprot:338989_1